MLKKDLFKKVKVLSKSINYDGKKPVFLSYEDKNNSKEEKDFNTIVSLLDNKEDDTIKVYNKMSIEDFDTFLKNVSYINKVTKKLVYQNMISLNMTSLRDKIVNYNNVLSSINKTLCDINVSKTDKNLKCKLYDLMLLKQCNKEKCPAYDTDCTYNCVYLDYTMNKSDKDLFRNYLDNLETDMEDDFNKELKLDYIRYDVIIYNILKSFFTDLYYYMNNDNKFINYNNYNIKFSLSFKNTDTTHLKYKFKMLYLYYTITEDLPASILSINILDLYVYILYWLKKNQPNHKEMFIAIINYIYQNKIDNNSLISMMYGNIEKNKLYINYEKIYENINNRLQNINSIRTDYFNDITNIKVD